MENKLEKKDTNGRLKTDPSERKEQTRRLKVEVRENILNTKYAAMYLEIYDDIAHNRIKEDKNLFNYKSKYSNRNHWGNLTKEFMRSSAEDIVYKYCLHKAKTIVSTELTHEAKKRKR